MFSDQAQAIEEARMKAAQIAAGRVEAADMTRSDRDELQAARKLAGDVPVLAALEEWAKAREISQGQVIAAAEAFAARNVGRIARIKVSDAVDRFIAAKEKAGKQGERTYRAKLRPLVAFVGDAYLDSIGAPTLTAYLEQYQDGTTRNDLRKRAVALWRWAQRSGHLSRGTELEIAHTERAAENRSEIGILSPSTFAKLLEFFRRKRPEFLPAVVLAGFCGIRADEIHGKRADRNSRQLWEDVRFDQEIVRVTVAKKNTPAWRHAPLCQAAIDWLRLAKTRKGPVCDPGALELARLAARNAGFVLPGNCLRHSFISYRIAVLDGDKPRVATEAGNSVSEIDRRYRVPVTKPEAMEWFGTAPQRIS